MNTYSSPTHLNMAAFCTGTHSLGPGLRAAIWVQGCQLSCSGCIAPEWIPLKPAQIVTIESIAKVLTELPTLDGLTISGGEPMLQPEALGLLVSQVRRFRSINVICFSGFIYEHLKQYPLDSGVSKFLREVDVLIDGPYQKNSNNDTGLRGSANQQIHHLTPALQMYDLSSWPRSIEIFIRQQEMLIAGIPPKKVQNALNKLSFDPVSTSLNGGL